MKKTLMAGALAVLTLAAAGGVAMAQQAGARAPEQRAPEQRAMRADADGDSRISQAEFLGQRVQRLTAADADRDGSVSVEEMRAAGQARMAQHADARFQRLDANSDGVISRAEFDGQRAGRAEARSDRGARPARMHGGGGGGGRKAHGGQHAGQRGPVSIAEAQVRAEQAFARLDADRDGFITAAERQAMRGQRHERMTERRAARQAQRQASPPASASE